jgi:hypothetical protein
MMPRFTLVLILVLFIGQTAVCAQVNTECRAIDSPFLTYEDASQMEAGMLSIGQSASIATGAVGDSLSAPGIDFGLGLDAWLELSGFWAIGGWQRNRAGFRVRSGESYLGMKLLLLSIAHSYSAVAVKPALDLLGSGNGVGRSYAVLPLILGKDVKLCNMAFTASTCHTIKGRRRCIQRQFLTSSSCSS